ncbi:MULTISPECIES: FAD-dependent monooxygenase [unclassified Streptomyces]|uniref:FAD-dependent monooxygenase n=1 Tax=unclassified Streptomyces TaxID=2593676 RepID=UPI003818CFA3
MEWDTTRAPLAGDSPEVLIVGAGPVGITLACELLQQGVRIRLIDRRARIDESDPHSKGILVWPRSLEVLRRIGVSERLAATGHRSKGVGYYSEGRLRGTAHLHRLPDSPYPFVLTLPQRETERVLRDRLAELGGTIEFGVTLEELDTTSQTLPRAVLSHADGSAETVLPLYLVGADGPGSATREMLGIRFDGEPIDVTYAIGDAPITGGVPADAQYYYSRDGVVALVPLAGGHYRIAANIPHRGADEGNPSRELIEEVINRRAHTAFKVGEPVWTRSFRPRLGLAERFSQGHCFLVGDSAHVISPAGGQGMNIGFQDAANLGWKLGGVIQGRLDEAILETYHPERSVGAVRMSKTSAAQARFAMQRSTLRIAVRDAVFVTARWTGLIQKILVPLLAQADVDYSESVSDPLFRRIPHPARVGQRVPLFAPPVQDNGVPALDPYKYTVVLWPGGRTPQGWAATAAGLRRRFTDQVAVLDLGAVDPSAAKPLRRAFGRRPVIATVRPDGHLAHLAPVTAPEQAQAFLRKAAPTEVPVPVLT